MGLSPLLAAALILVAWAALTGMLHLDGWADCCDALVAPLSRERRLEVMKDPRLGSFGGAGLILLLLVKLAAVAEVLAPTGWPAAGCAAAAPGRPRPGSLGRRDRRGVISAGAAGWHGRQLSSRAGPARGHPRHADHSRRVPFMGWGGLVLWAAAGLTLLGMGRLATARLGGLTGDVYGAIVELTETVTLVVSALLILK